MAACEMHFDRLQQILPNSITTAAFQAVLCMQREDWWSGSDDGEYGEQAEGVIAKRRP